MPRNSKVKNNTQNEGSDTEQLLIFESNADKGDYKEAYRQIRNYLAGQFIGATRDEALLLEVIKCLFCKIYLSKKDISTNDLDESDVEALYQKSFTELHQVIPTLFGEHAIFKDRENLILNSKCITYIDQRLSKIDLQSWSRDPFGDVYEVFVGSVIRGQEGQFFTPQNAIEVLVSLVDPKPGERFIDPACGAGGFLNAIARHLVASGNSNRNLSDWIYGIDKDSYLAKLAAARLSLVTLSPTKVFCADSLAWINEDKGKFSLENLTGTFDGVITNPPFGSKIVSVLPDIQKSFDLGYKWKVDKTTGSFIKSKDLHRNVPPQVLFIERCLSLVRPGGRIGMVVPESLISSKNHRYVVNYLRSKATLQAVLGMPESLFKISGKGGTHTKTCLILFQKKQSDTPSDKDKRVFMAEVKWCGHDSRGRQIEYDELPTVCHNYHRFKSNHFANQGHVGYAIFENQIKDNILAPRYYNPEVNESLNILEETHNLINFGDLVRTGLIQISTGDEVGKLAYGTGSIPFVRTSDISNWEVKLDPKHGVSDVIYQAYAQRQDVREGDILMVRDGTYLIGTCAFITKYDTRIIYQSHLYKIRITKPENLSPYLLLAVLSSMPVQQQIKSKRFTQDIIDSLGDRIHELVLPIPKDEALRNSVTKMVKKVIQERIEARELARQACIDVIGNKVNELDFEEREIIS